MSKTLFLIEAPGKVTKISHLLGDSYEVVATIGHLIDLNPKEMSVDLEHNFEPTYVPIDGKSKLITQIKKYAKSTKDVILATDQDREGEMIAWGIASVLNLKNPKRIAYTEITKTAILEAIKNVRNIDKDLVDAQKTRRILDRIVGYELSPLLLKVLHTNNLSAGRVQSVVARLIMDREKEINEFFKDDTNSVFKVEGTFTNKKDTLSAKLYSGNEIAGITKLDKIKKIMDKFVDSTFTVSEIEKKEGKQKPSPPFSTSTMQQEAGRKFGMTAKRTMMAAQNLYEAGLISYIRTDSITLSEDAHKNIQKYVEKAFGEDYYSRRQYKSKSVNAQEAHEAIRPTDVSVTEVAEKGKIQNDEIKLYSLIWKRTVASQMVDAKIQTILVHIGIDKLKDYQFISQTKKILFFGFLKVYNLQNIENDEEKEDVISKIPDKGTVLKREEIVAKQTYDKPPSHFDDASLIHKMDQLEIGRPATTASIIAKILEREYVKKDDVSGVEKDSIVLTLTKNIVHEDVQKVFLGKEVNKFVPTELGKIVVDFLLKYFPDVMSYEFTAEMEKKLDEIAAGKLGRVKLLTDFYKQFHKIVENVKTNIKTLDIPTKQMRLLGKHPETDLEIYATVARYGPVIKMCAGKKCTYAPIPKSLTVDTIKLVDALELLKYPKLIGTYEDNEIKLQKGKYGFYLIYGKEKISTGDKEDITEKDAIALIKEKLSNVLWTASEGKKTYKILNGQYGEYLSISGVGKARNIKLPKDFDIKEMSVDKVKEIIKNAPKKRRFVKKT